MTRPIKFRAWDRGKSKMVDTNRHGLNFEGIVVAYHHTAGRWNYLGSENYELMQFTGLLDKNGKEIYEGDIVNSWDYRLTKGEKSGHGNLLQATITWTNYGFHLMGENGGHEYLGQANRQYEVIGNIYENKDLLK